ncbi:MAG: ABC transporter permease [Alphaproteobacteria bacterium]
MQWLPRIKAVMFKEFLQLSRDKLTFALILVLPLVQLTLFGYAINTDVRNVKAGIVDESQSQIGRLITQKVAQTQVVNFTHHYQTTQQAYYGIEAGEVRAVLVIPKDVGQRLVQNRPLGQWMVDGSDSAVSGAILGLQNMPFSLYDKLGNIPNNQGSTASFEMTLFYNPAMRTSINIVPGLVGVILTMTMVLFTAIAIVREREQGNMELLITTPVSSLELMIAKIIPYIFVGLIQVVIILGLGHLLFEVPINGSIIQIFLGALLFISASLSLGLIISTFAQTQLQAMQMTIFLLLPSILLSGFMFPSEGMPLIAQWIAEVLPVTHFMRIIRGIVLRGADLGDLWKDSLWLGIFTIIGLVIASKRFKKSLD